MNNKLAILICLVFLTPIFAHAKDVRFINYDPQDLQQARQYAQQHAKQKNIAPDPALARLLHSADRALQAPLHSVTDKTLLPASGERHDYFSFGPYWWPNPDSENGLPYIRKDGQVNPQYNGPETDKQSLVRFSKDVKTLSLAYYLTAEKKYANKAREKLVAWFIEPRSRMNPNLDHAQAVPGIASGRSFGIIEGRMLIDVLDGIEILADTLTPAEHTEIVQWFAELNHWLQSSKAGKDADDWHNNHGTWYDAQVVAFAIFTNDIETARERLQITRSKRIGHHFNSVGNQPAELERTRPWHYSNFNLEAYSLLGHYGEIVGVDIWNYQTGNKSLKKGYLAIAQYILNQDDWPYGRNPEFDISIALENLLYAEKAYAEPLFSKALAKLGANDDAQSKLSHLLL